MITIYDNTPLLFPLHNYLPYSDNAVGNVVLALWTVQFGLWYRVGAVRARSEWFLNFTLVRFPRGEKRQYLVVTYTYVVLCIHSTG